MHLLVRPTWAGQWEEQFHTSWKEAWAVSPSGVGTRPEPLCWSLGLHSLPPLDWVGKTGAGGPHSPLAPSQSLRGGS